jgi:hypothetical protein
MAVPINHKPKTKTKKNKRKHAASKNTYREDSVLPNEKDDPKMTKAR